ncbi:MAG: PAM68 family protein [Synechocystis sp.]|nr:PAM68 family protein [Synechocystis sp.]
MPDSSSRDRLPFERKSKKKKIEKKPPDPLSTGSKTAKKPRRKVDENRIPEVVSRRMVRRMALFSGIPTALGMSSFFVFYLIVSRDWLEIPNYVAFAVSLLFFGLGVLGLSYGIFSTSWEESLPGSWWGWSEFRLNVGRMLNAWRNARQEAQAAKDN